MLLLIILLIRHYRANANKLNGSGKPINPLKTINKALYVAGLCLLSLNVPAQDKHLVYKVLHYNNVIGSLDVQESMDGTRSHIRIESEVKTRLVISLVIHTIEETTFEKGALTFSSTHRTLNGKEKTNSQIRLNGSTYKITNAGKVKEFDTGLIYFNMLSLYATEPKLHARAYADNYRQYVPIARTGEFEYRVTLPDGNSNYYTYRDGICVKVEVDNALYALKFVLTNQR